VTGRGDDVAGAALRARAREARRLADALLAPLAADDARAARLHALVRELDDRLDDALRTKELVKVQFARAVDVPAKDAANALATATASEVVQVIGKTATLYRHNPELARKGDTPPWKS
jgi:RNA-binding protein YhbY